MVRSPKVRRTPSSRKPVTIDLDANAASEVDTDIENPVQDAQAEPVAFDQLDEKSEINDAMPNDDISDNADAPNDSVDAVAPPPPVSKGSGSGLMSGLIGGLVAILGLAGLQWGGVLPSFAPSTEQVAVSPVDISPLQAEIDALKLQVANMGETAASSQTEIDQETRNQISAALQASDEALSTVSETEAVVTDLKSEVDQLQSAISSGASGENAGLEAVSQRLDGFDAQIADMTSKLSAETTSQAPSAELTAQLGEVTSKIAQIETTVSTQADKISNIEAVATEAQATAAKLSEEIAEGSGANANVASAIAVAGLKTAIDRGSSFMAELEAYATVSEKPEVVDELRQFAASGVATINQLSDSFPVVANKIVATGQGLAEDASVTDRLMASARSLVQVRPVGEVEGDTPGAIAARIEARLKQADLTNALIEWETLPDAAKAVSADFADKIRARQAVDAMVGDALNNAMAATAPSAN